MSVSPAPTAVTRPEPFTVATALLDDCQVARPVTFWPVPFERIAAAVNCTADPAAGGDPLITIVDTVDDGVA